MADWNKPATTSTKANFPTEIRDVVAHAAKMDFSGDTNLPSTAIRYNRSTNQFEEWDGASWNAKLITNLKDGAVSTAAKLASDVVTTPKILDANVTTPKLAAGVALPIGAILPYGGSSAPTSYLLCDGSAVSRSTYADLFAVLATTYGVGNGTTTFNLPDLRQRFPLGKAASGTGSTLGGTGGNIDHVHSGPSHTHDMGNHTHAGPSHSHTSGTLRAAVGSNPGTNEYIFLGLDGGNPFTASYKYTGGPVGITADSSSIASSVVNGSTAAGGTGNTSTPSTNTTSASGTGNTGAANPPYQVVNYIIKALA